MKTVLRIVCIFCKEVIGEKDGKGQTGDSHSICERCWNENYPQWAYHAELREDTKSKEEHGSRQ